MATQYVTYSTKAYLACAACAPFDVIIQLEPGFASQQGCYHDTPDTWEYQTIRGQVTTVVKHGEVYEYTLSYESDDIINPTLDPEKIEGVACVGPLGKYLIDRVGFDPFITENDNGTFTFHSNHGCEYSFGVIGGGDLFVTDTDSVDLSLTIEFGLQAYVRISEEEGNGLEVRDGGLFATSGWSTLGNLGTVDGTNFLGTIDNIPLDIRVNNLRAYRFVPHSAAATIIGGFEGNIIPPTTAGALIAGGGFASNINTIASGNYAAIGGGAKNTITDGVGGVIAGGFSNSILNTSQYANISGGTLNTVTGDFSVIAGGKQNTYLSLSQYGFIGGGTLNQVDGNYNVLGGGTNNRILSGTSAAVLGGGANNTLTGLEAIIVGGKQQTVYGTRSTIGGGFANSIGTISEVSTTSTICGGQSNTIGGGANDCTLGGGRNNIIQVSGTSSQTIAGGRQNTTNASYTTIGGGQLNVISSQYATIPGGFTNSIGAACNHGFVAGRNNSIVNLLGPNLEASSIGGGNAHILQSSSYGGIHSGYTNKIDLGNYSSISGGNTNTILDSIQSFIGNGNLNGITSSLSSVIAGGKSNYLLGSTYSVIVGGNLNVITGVVGVSSSQYSFIGGGFTHIVDNSLNSFIGGGATNRIFYSGFSSIVGGKDNGIQHFGGHLTPTYSFIGGGSDNIIDISDVGVICGGIDGRIFDSDYSAIVGGQNNDIEGSLYSFVGGGQDNVIKNSSYSFIGGGQDNDIEAAVSSFIGGGKNNKIFNCLQSSILGGSDNTITSVSTTSWGSTILGGRGLKLGSLSIGFHNPGSLYHPDGPYSFSLPTEIDLSAYQSIAYFGDCDIWIGNIFGSAGDLAGLKLFGGPSFGAGPFPAGSPPYTYENSFFVKLIAAPDLSYAIEFPVSMPVSIGDVLKVVGFASMPSGLPLARLEWGVP